jgi:hypothetical protein
MKLNTALVEQAVTQLGADPIPEQHPAMPQLNRVFGDHTFFVDTSGLHILEPCQPAADTDEPRWEVMKIAGWSDGQRTTLTPQPPEPTGIIVVLADAEAEDDDTGAA